MQNSADAIAKELGVAKKISAMICTRNRGDTVVMAVRTMLANTHPDFECVVIDQSTDSITEAALAPYLQNPRFRYVHSDSKGLGKSHNIGMQCTIGEIIAITDDDCEVPVDWLEKIESAFTQDDKIGILFCLVNAAEHDSDKGFVPSYHTHTDRTVMVLPDGSIEAGLGGIGAGMAVRRSCIEAIGGFDDHLGPGAIFPSADESDVKVRALLKGYSILMTAQTHVLHYGFRTWEEGKQLTIRDTLASGAANSKHFRSGARWARRMIMATFIHLTTSVYRDSIREKRPRGAKRVISYARGFISGMCTPIDRETLLFKIPDS